MNKRKEVKRRKNGKIIFFLVENLDKHDFFGAWLGPMKKWKGSEMEKCARLLLSLCIFFFCFCCFFSLLLFLFSFVVSFISLVSFLFSSLLLFLFSSVAPFLFVVLFSFISKIKQKVISPPKIFLTCMNLLILWTTNTYHLLNMISLSLLIYPLFAFFFFFG